jgi:hypothetical protein
MCAVTHQIKINKALNLKPAPYPILVCLDYYLPMYHLSLSPYEEPSVNQSLSLLYLLANTRIYSLFWF